MSKPDLISLNNAQSIPEISLQPKSKVLTRGQCLNKIYSLPAPLCTFPLPAYTPHNPISLIHIIFIWFSQKFGKNSSHLTPLYQGVLSPETHSVHITDTRAIRGLWEQGFYGKGSLSRSEPAWLEGEKALRENKNVQTSEEITRKRRAERQKLKWERARKERIAIDHQLLEEANSSLIAGSQLVPIVSQEPSEILSNIPKLKLTSPVGPMELLSLPNSQSELDSYNSLHENPVDIKQVGIAKDAPTHGEFSLPVNPHTSTSLDHGISESNNLKTNKVNKQLDREPVLLPHSEPKSSGAHKSDFVEQDNSEDNKIHRLNTCSDHSIKLQNFEISNPINGAYDLQDFNKTLPAIPSKHFKDTRLSCSGENIMRPSDTLRSHQSLDLLAKQKEDLTEIKNEEHLQLTLEEAFFLSYALGSLQVLDPVTQNLLTNQNLFKQLKQISSSPTKDIQTKSLDNKFVTSYVVYHHFRSLGWVVRSGIKFSVDYLLYNRGPVFSHAEFSVLVLPSYSDPYWSSTDFLTRYSRHKQHRSWSWMACINRVISQVKKTLILCYVDIPPPLSDECEETMDLDAMLARYRIREFVISRFLTNRMRS